MKTHTLNQIESHRFQPTKNMPNLLKRALVLASALAVLSGTLAQAAPVDKANNSAALSLGTSWVGGTAPGPNIIAAWSNDVSSAYTTGSLGASTNWEGIQILTPGGNVAILNDGFTNTLGTVGVVGLNGIDMSSAGVNLTLSNCVVLNGVQNWNVNSGKTLSLGGNFLRNAGSVLRFGLTGGSTAIITNGSAVVSATASPNAILGSTYGSVFFGTVNDVDFAAEVSASGGFQIVGGSTIGGLYTANGTGNTDPGNANVIDVNNDASGAWGQRASNTRVWPGFRFNIPQVYNNNGAFATYNGVGAWVLDIPSGRTVTCNSVLITTNVLTAPVLVNNGALSGGTTGFFRIGSGGTQDLLIYQNNYAAPFIICPNITINQQGTGSLVKMGVGQMQIQNGSSYTGGTEVYEGTLEIDGFGTVGVGPLQVFGGNFAQSSAGTNFAPVTVSSGATNSVLINATGGNAIDNSNLTFNAGTILQFVYSNSISPSATVPALFVTNNVLASPLTVASPVTINVLCGNLSLGQFPLAKYSGTVGGSGGSAFVLGTIEPLVSGYISNNTANSSIDLVVTNVLQPLHWAQPGSGTWDINITSDWKDNGGNTTTYQQIGSMGDNVSFDAVYSSGSPTVTLNTNPIPASVTFAGANSYTLTGNGSISGLGSVIISGPSTTFIQTSNSFTGGLNINGGILNFTTLTNLGAGAINFGGGTLQYASGNVSDISVGTVTFGAGNGTIDLNGNAVTFANVIGNGGAGGFTLTGNNTLTLNGTNRYSGNTIINSGSTLLLSANTYISNSAAIIVNGTLNAINSTLTLSTPASQILAGTGTVRGEIAMGSGTTITPATNGTIGTLTINGDLTVNGGTLQMDINGTSGTRDLIAINSTGGIGSGNLNLNGGTINVNITGNDLANGNYPLITYTGTLGGGVVNMNLTGWQSFLSQYGQLAYLSVGSGVLNMTVISGNTNSVVWVGGGANAWDLVTANWMVNGVASPLGDFANGNAVTFNDSGSASPAVSLGGMFLPASVTINVTNNNYTFSGSGNLSGNTGLIINSATTNITTILTPNSNGGATSIKGGTLQVGNGSVNGGIGTGNVTNNGTLIFDQTVNTTVAAISGNGKLIQEGSGTLTLLVNNSYTGLTSISNASVLQVGTGGTVGSLGTGPVTNNGTLFFDVKAPVTVNNISGSGSVTFEPLTITLGSALSYQGNTLVTNGSLKLTANNQIPNAVTVPGSTGIFGLGGTLDLGGYNQTVNGLTDLGVPVGSLITNSAATGTNVLTIGNGLINTTNTYSGLIMDNTNFAAIELVILNPGTTILATNGNTYRGGTIVGLGTLQCGQGGPNIDGVPGTGTITLSNATTLLLGGNDITFVGNPVTIAPNSTVTFAEAAAGGYSDTYSGLVSGDANSTNVIGSEFTFENNNNTPVAPQLNGFNGTVLIPDGTGVVGDGTGIRWYGNPQGGTNTTFEIDGTGQMWARDGADVIWLGALQGNGGISLPANLGGAGATYVIGSKGIDSIFSGTIGGFNNIIKVGAGRLTFNGATNVIYGLDEFGDTTTNYILTNVVTYVGATTVSNGVLALIAPNSFNLTNFTSFILAGSTAVLDLSSAGYSPDGATLITNSTLTLASPQTLTGIGTIRGSLVAGSGTIVEVGFGPNTNGSPVTGVLTITNNVELSGQTILNITSTNSSEIVAGGTITTDPGTLVVTNAGSGLFNGTQFTLFNQHVSGFASVTLPAMDPTGTTNYYWKNNLAVDGTITLTNGGLIAVNLNPTNIVTSFNFGTGVLTLSWPADHIGWQLQAQTNSASVGLSTNWVDVAGSSATNQVILTVDKTKGTVFFRLVSP